MEGGQMSKYVLRSPRNGTALTVSYCEEQKMAELIFLLDACQELWGIFSLFILQKGSNLNIFSSSQNENFHFI